MADAPTPQDKKAFEHHLRETEDYIERIEKSCQPSSRQPETPIASDLSPLDANAAPVWGAGYA